MVDIGAGGTGDASHQAGVAVEQFKSVFGVLRFRAFGV